MACGRHKPGHQASACPASVPSGVAERVQTKEASAGCFWEPDLGTPKWDQVGKRSHRESLPALKLLPKAYFCSHLSFQPLTGADVFRGLSCPPLSTLT